MNNKIAIVMLIALGFAAAGGLDTAYQARKAHQRNERVKEINVNVARVTKTLDRMFLAKAEPCNDLMDLAPPLRQKNWGGGSCVFASSVSLLRWPGKPELTAKAEEVRRRYSGGESAGPHKRKMIDDLGLKMVVTTDGDEKLIEWALATRRGCGVGWGRMHCTCLIGKEMRNGQIHAVILDNNHVDRFTYVPWDQWVREWKGLGGWAFAFVYDPPPPIPK